MEDYINIFWLSGSFWVPLIFCLILLVPSSFEGFSSQKFKQLRFMLVSIYALFFLCSLVSIIGKSEPNFHETIRLYIPFVAVYHIILFSSINNLLINPSYSPKKNIPKILLLATLFSAFYLLSYFALSNTLFLVSSVLLYFVIFVMGITLSINFFKSYRKNIHVLDSCFSDSTRKHLIWVRNNQIFILIVVHFVLFTSKIPDRYIIGFLGVLLIFYIFYTIRLFMNAEMFFKIGQFIEIDTNENQSDKPTSIHYSALETVLEKWVLEKKYLQPDVTILSVASEIGTNRTYLSNYLNSNKKQTFREWINKLRVEEAKMLMLSGIELSVNEIIFKVGYSDKNIFKQHFSKIEGISLHEWIQKHDIT